MTTIPKLQALVRAQTALTRIELRCKATQVTYAACALILGLIALGMLNVAGFLGLSDVVGQAWSAFILAIVDLIAAVLLIRVARDVRPGPEAEMAREVRDIVLAELSSEAQSVRNELEQVRTDVRRIRSSFSSLSNGFPLGIGPVVEILTKTLRRRKKRR